MMWRHEYFPINEDSYEIGFNTDYMSSKPLKTLVMLCNGVNNI